MQRLRRLLPALWLGVLICIGAMAAPSLFAALPAPDAGRVAGRLFAQEAYLGLGFAVVLFLAERQRARVAAAAGAGSLVSANLLLVCGALFCTVAGYFAVQPMMAAARAGQGGASFGLLHGVSAGFFTLKGLLLAVLAWRVAAG